ncbi:MAG TPA: hypothetical protein VNQ99_12295 [Xanthobacteraceae bacterium]|nr:hypothetical protein [Xanthobacteraceae bacterium]
MQVQAIGGASEEILARHRVHAIKLGFPRLGEARLPDVAIVGGGPSILGHVEELRSIEAEVWAINGAWRWCRENGIDAAFLSVDPLPAIARMARGAERAILSTSCHPDVFATLQNADVEAVHVGGDDGLLNGPTTATTAPMIAFERGHRRVLFYGCEGNFDRMTHAYGNCRPLDDLVRVECGGKDFLTSPDMLCQVDFLAALLRSCPDIMIDRSGGLLSAAIAHEDVDVIALSPKLRDEIWPTH